MHSYKTPWTDGHRGLATIGSYRAFTRALPMPIFALAYLRRLEMEATRASDERGALVAARSRAIGVGLGVSEKGRSQRKGRETFFPEMEAAWTASLPCLRGGSS